MKIVGLGGSLAAGKTTAVAICKNRLRLPVWEADRAAHGLMAKNGEAVAEIEAAFGHKVKSLKNQDGINRRALGQYVFADRARLKKLERILHPKISALRYRFLQKSRRLRRKVVVLDIPLLFEGGGWRSCHLTILIRCPKMLLARRLAVRGLELNVARNILAYQLSDEAKAKLADVVISSGLGRAHTLRKLKAALKPTLVSEAEATNIG